jgi:hypothetical protein
MIQRESIDAARTIISWMFKITTEWLPSMKTLANYVNHSSEQVAEIEWWKNHPKNCQGDITYPI